MSIANEAMKRVLMLALSYANKDRNWTAVRAESFSTPLTKHGIMVIGRDFHRDNLIRDFP